MSTPRSLSIRRATALLLLVCLPGWALPAAAAVVFISGSVHGKATAEVEQHGPKVIDEQTHHFTAPQELTRYEVSAFAQGSTNGGGLTQVTTRLQIEVDWNGPEQGSVSIDQSFGGFSHGLVGFLEADGNPLWNYTFQVDRDSRLQLQYDVHRDPIVGGFSHGGFTLTLDGLGYADFLVDSQGLLEIDLEAGKTYAFGLVPDIFGLAIFVPQGYASGYLGFFQWAIAEATPPPSGLPEPSGLPLVLLALTAAGATRGVRPRAPG